MKRSVCLLLLVNVSLCLANAEPKGIEWKPYEKKTPGELMLHDVKITPVKSHSFILSGTVMESHYSIETGEYSMRPTFKTVPSSTEIRSPLTGRTKVIEGTNVVSTGAERVIRNVVNAEKPWRPKQLSVEHPFGGKKILFEPDAEGKFSVEVHTNEQYHVKKPHLSETNRRYIELLRYVKPKNLTIRDTSSLCGDYNLELPVYWFKEKENLKKYRESYIASVKLRVFDKVSRDPVNGKIEVIGVNVEPYSDVCARMISDIGSEFIVSQNLPYYYLPQGGKKSDWCPQNRLELDFTARVGAEYLVKVTSDGYLPFSGPLKVEKSGRSVWDVFIVRGDEIIAASDDPLTGEIAEEDKTSEEPINF